MRITTAFLEQTGDIRHPVRECGRLTTDDVSDALAYAKRIARCAAREVHEADTAQTYLEKNFVFNCMRRLIDDADMTSYANAVEPPTNDEDAQMLLIVWVDGCAADAIQCVPLKDRIANLIVLDEMSSAIGELARDGRLPLVFSIRVSELMKGDAR